VFVNARTAQSRRFADIVPENPVWNRFQTLQQCHPECQLRVYTHRASLFVYVAAA
jgi:hypothetical protein